MCPQGIRSWHHHLSFLYVGKQSRCDLLHGPPGVWVHRQAALKDSAQDVLCPGVPAISHLRRQSYLHSSKALVQVTTSFA